MGYNLKCDILKIFRERLDAAYYNLETNFYDDSTKISFQKYGLYKKKDGWYNITINCVWFSSFLNQRASQAKSLIYAK